MFDASGRSFASLHTTSNAQACGDPLGFAGVEMNRRQCLHSALRRQQPFGEILARELLRRASFLDAKAADRRADQTRHYGVAAERLGQIASQGTDVRARAAFDLNTQFRVVVTQDFQTINRHRPWLQIDVLPGPRQVVCPATLNFKRRVGRRALHDLADQPAGSTMDLFERRLRRLRVKSNFPLNVFRRAALAQQKRRPVSLLHALHVFDQARRRADADHEHAGGQRVERSGMARLGRPDQSLDDIDRLPRGDSLRLIEHDQAAARLSVQRFFGRRHGVQAFLKGMWRCGGDEEIEDNARR